MELLTLGELEIEGQLVDASNLALLARLERGGVETRVMYKPVRGERPLWDFPSGTLANREAASYVVSAAGGWDVVPPTVLRDGPAGRGTVQLWIEGLDGTDDEDVVVPRPEGLVDLVPAGRVEPGWLPVFEAELHNGSPVVVAHADRPDLAAVAVLDIVINNADRKGSHLVLDRQGSLWGFDHGLSFHEELKLRTVLWGWAGTPLPDVELSRLDALATDLSAPLQQPGAGPRRAAGAARRCRPCGHGWTGCCAGAVSRARGTAGPPSPGRRCEPCGQLDLRARPGRPRASAVSGRRAPV